jgi:hypothetical protein
MSFLARLRTIKIKAREGIGIIIFLYKVKIPAGLHERTMNEFFSY